MADLCHNLLSSSRCLRLASFPKSWGNSWSDRQPKSFKVCKLQRLHMVSGSIMISVLERLRYRNGFNFPIDFGSCEIVLELRSKTRMYQKAINILCRVLPKSFKYPLGNSCVRSFFVSLMIFRTGCYTFSLKIIDT